MGYTFTPQEILDLAKLVELMNAGRVSRKIAQMAIDIVSYKWARDGCACHTGNWQDVEPCQHQAVMNILSLTEFALYAEVVRPWPFI